MDFKLNIIASNLLDDYLKQVPKNLENDFEALKEAEISTDSFSFYTSVSSVFSSKIEGENIELDSYIKHKKFGVEFLPNHTKKIDDLYDAYTFAQTAVLNKENITATHKIVSKHLLTEHLQGLIRTQNMYVTTPNGQIEYVAATPAEVNQEMEKFYADVEKLLKQKLTINEVFFFASMIHLVFVKIHPWNDGNGRSARLIEKWFLAQKLGKKAWFLQSEKKYYDLHATYYKNIRALGIEYLELDYSKALPFLLMLPNSFII
jgi:Fic family protein